MKREAWVDYIKVLACILVVLGHFFQSMVKASILSENYNGPPVKTTHEKIIVNMLSAK